MFPGISESQLRFPNSAEAVENVSFVDLVHSSEGDYVQSLLFRDLDRRNDR